MKYLLLLACTQDVSIMKVYDNEDTSEEVVVVDTTEDTEVEVEPSIEPSEEPDTTTQELNGNVGYVNYYLRHKLLVLLVLESCKKSLLSSKVNSFRTLLLLIQSGFHRLELAQISY